MFAAEGAPLFDADAAVHDYYRGPGAARVEEAFPGILANGAVGPQPPGAKSGSAIAWRSSGSRRSFILRSPLCGGIFFRAAAVQGRRLGRRRRAVAVRNRAATERLISSSSSVSASEIVQKARALARDGMTLTRFRADYRQADARPGKKPPPRPYGHRYEWARSRRTRAQVRGFLRCAAGMTGKRAGLDA